MPQIQEVISWVKEGDWREFAAFAGPELADLTAWDDKVVLVGDASHALSGAFGSGAGFAIEDGWVLAQALKYYLNDLHQALPLFNRIRLPYYSRMYEHLSGVAGQRMNRERNLGANATYDERVRAKLFHEGGIDMAWIYRNDIGKVWEHEIRS